MYARKLCSSLVSVSWLTVIVIICISIIYSSAEVTTESPYLQFSDDISCISKANILLSKLNTDISEHLKKTTNLEDQFTTATINSEPLLYGVINSEDNIGTGSNSAKFPFSASSKDKKFETVLHNINILEDQVEEAISNFTASKRFSFSAMLKPMLRNISQLRENLTLLRSRLIGVTALSSIAEQVNELTDKISEALTNDQPISSESIDRPFNDTSKKNNNSKSDQLESKMVQVNRVTI